MLKNYTSTVPAKRSIEYIEAKLVQHGATQIMKIYHKDYRLKAMFFSIRIDGVDMPFKLPANVDQCEKVLMANLSPRVQPVTRKKVPQQAERTAWKILQDWVEVQMAMIELAQVDVMEVFLPYLFDGKEDKTFYEKMKLKGLQKLLPAGTNPKR